MPDKQIPWVVGILFAIVLTGGVAFIGYVQERISTGYLLINGLTDKVARMEEREKAHDLIHTRTESRLTGLERERVFPR